MRVTLIDDDRMALAGLRQMLAWSSFDGEPAGEFTNGIDALARMKKQPPDVVISDIKMPGMDGLELARYLYENLPGVRMILISGHSEFAYAQRAIQYQVVDYILKPITRDKINALNARLCEIHQTITQEKTSFLSAWDSTLREQTLEALRGGELSEVDRLLNSDTVRHALAQTAKDPVGVQLLNFLYEYLAGMGVDKAHLAQTKQQALAEYWELSDPQDKLAFLVEKFNRVICTVETQKNSYTDPIVAAAKQAVAQHYHEPDFNVSSLANQLHISLSYLSTVFKQTTGDNLSSYLINTRLAAAQAALLDISIPIANVSARCGYEDARYFAKAFKKHTGMTPSEYRNTHTRGKEMG